MNARSIKFWTNFWSIGIFILSFIVMIVLSTIPNIHKAWIAIILPLNFVAIGLDHIISTKLKLPHIYSLNQKIKRQIVTYYPFEMDWKNNFNSKKMIRDGVVLLIIGLVLSLSGLIILLVN